MYKTSVYPLVNGNV